MVYESRYWKDPLLHSARLIDQFKGIDLNEDELGRLEHAIPTGFFSIRKLLDAELKLSLETIESAIIIKRFPFIGQSEVHLFNRHDISSHYDLSISANASLSLKGACNQFIHSYVFIFEHNEENGSVDGVFVCSDFEKQKCCYLVSLDEIEKLFTRVGSDYPSDIHMRFENGKWEVDRSGSVKVKPERRK